MKKVIATLNPAASPQISAEDSITQIERLSDAAQRYLLDMLAETSSSACTRQYAVTCHEMELLPELRTLPLLHENPYPLAEVLSDLPKPLLLYLLGAVRRSDKPKPSAPSSEIISWLTHNVPMLASELPPVASFSFSESFIEAQPAVYSYLSSKYSTTSDS